MRDVQWCLTDKRIIRPDAEQATSRWFVATSSHEKTSSDLCKEESHFTSLQAFSHAIEKNAVRRTMLSLPGYNSKQNSSFKSSHLLLHNRFVYAVTPSIEPTISFVVALSLLRVRLVLRTAMSINTLRILAFCTIMTRSHSSLSLLSIKASDLCCHSPLLSGYASRNWTMDKCDHDCNHLHKHSFPEDSTYCTTSSS